jgi:hypothetical protein
MERNEIEKRRKGENLLAIYLNWTPRMCSGIDETLRTLTAPSVVALS